MVSLLFLSADAQDTAGASPPEAGKIGALTHSLKTEDSLAIGFRIRSISIEGNKRTRSSIILRELPFQQGDSILLHQISENFEEAENRLMNTTLFHEAHLSVLKFSEGMADVKVSVLERWYIMPFPHLKPVDRNISQWLFKENAALNRVDYGAKLHWDNVTGNNDKLRFYFVTGYTRQLMLSYQRPFMDKNMKWGINYDLSVGKSHELNYATVENRQKFLKLKDHFVRNFFKTSIALTYRPAFYSWHTFALGYNFLKVHDSILKLNPGYLKIPGANSVGYPDFYYRYLYRNLDYNPYPSKGYAAELQLNKTGWGKNINLWQLTAKGIGYWPLTKNSFYSVGVGGILKVPFSQPYITSQLLGYGDAYLRGYEYFVMDGVAGGYTHATIAHQIANFKVHIPGTKWLTPRLIPLKIYAKAYGNAGYAYQPKKFISSADNNRLTNKMLYGGGFGLDVVTMYDFTLKIEFSFNQLGQNGLYLQKKSTFQ